MAQKSGLAHDAVHSPRSRVVSVAKWVRSAFWIGKPHPGAEEQFISAMNVELVPGLRALPGVRAAHALWPTQRDDAPPDIACQVLVEFDSREDLDRMLASPERRVLRARVGAVATLFNGSLSHINYETG